MNPEKICVSLADMSFIEAHRLCLSYPLVEIRLDRIRMTPEQIALLGTSATRWVATCREGRYDSRERTVQLSAAIRAGATWVDVEYEAPSNYAGPIIDLARRLGTRVIVSYHNFERCPSRKELDEIINSSFDRGADDVKIAVMAATPAEAARVMALYEVYGHIIAFAMGEHGRITRIAAPLLGSPFTYAAFDQAHATAPGQMTVNEMIRLPM